MAYGGKDLRRLPLAQDLAASLMLNRTGSTPSGGAPTGAGQSLLNGTSTNFSNMVDPGGGQVPVNNANAQKAAEYLMRIYNNIDWPSVLKAWNTEGQGAALSKPFFDSAMQAAGPNPFQGQGPPPAGMADLVWKIIEPQMAGNPILQRMFKRQLGLLDPNAASYDQYRGWPRAGGTFSGDPGLQAQGLDPAHLPPWYHF